jgi:phage tail-like protein
MVIGSALNVEFNLAMSTLRFQPGNVLVMLLNAEDIPIAGWLFQNTYPVEWSVSDLDATQNAIVIDTMKLHCGRMQSLRV